MEYKASKSSFLPPYPPNLLVTCIFYNTFPFPKPLAFTNSSFLTNYPSPSNSNSHFNFSHSSCGPIYVIYQNQYSSYYYSHSNNGWGGYQPPPPTLPPISDGTVGGLSKCEEDLKSY